MIKNIKYFILAIISCLMLAHAEDNPMKLKITKLKITIDNNIYFATLEDNNTAKDFLALLPLSVKLSDYNNTEKVTTKLSKKLSTSDDSFTPKIGDITYYSPWGNLALFYRGFHPSSGLYKIATFDDMPVDVFASNKTIQIKFELSN